MLAGCVYLPKLESNEASYSLPAAPSSRITQGLATAPEAQSRVVLVDAAQHALTSRLSLIDTADTSLDLQYFIWQNDSSGLLVIERLLAAADRGVRVRVLVDDIQLSGLTNKINALNSHENIQIRIFNPFSVRWRYQLGIWRLTEFVIDGNRLNHRMHNKLLVADNQLAILGGRNIGNDYFGLSPHRNFIDMDILMSGPLIPDLAEGFDQYWNSRWAQPINQLFNLSVVPDDLVRLRQRIDKRLDDAEGLAPYLQRYTTKDVLDDLLTGSFIEAADAIVDDPSVRWFDKPDELAKQMSHIALTAEHELLIVTPYLIPTRTLMALGRQLVERGVDIKIVTNSLETNDVVIAQAAYARHRRKIVDTGVELFELKGDAKIGGQRHDQEISLHQKYMVIDQKHVFLGSVNLDPRSLYLNTELGVILQAPELAAVLTQSFSELIQPQNAWQIVKNEEGICWQTPQSTLKRSPAKSLWQRLRYAFFSLLPVSQQI